MAERFIVCAVAVCLYIWNTKPPHLLLNHHHYSPTLSIVMELVKQMVEADANTHTNIHTHVQTHTHKHTVMATELVK